MTATGSLSATPTALPPVIDAPEVLSFGYAGAVDAITAALRGGLDPAGNPPRVTIPLGRGGAVLTMPAFDELGVGVKVVTHNPRNNAAGKPLVHGIYVHFDAETLAPVAILDGAALTTLRTPAVSMAGIRPALARFREATNVVVFGAGPQATGHVDALCDIAAVDGKPSPSTVTYVLRRDLGRPLPRREEAEVTAVQADSPTMVDALRRADIVVCATGSRAPLFDSSTLGDQAVVIAVGGHDPDASEVDIRFAGRATVVVEDRGTALRECGEVVQAIAAGVLQEHALVGIADLANRRAGERLASAPVLFKGSGMAWEDLVVAEAVIARKASAPWSACAPP